MKYPFLTAIIVACLSSSALAKPISYSIDPEHAKPHFSFNHLGLSAVVGRFDRVSGKIVLDLEAQTGSIDLSIDVTSVSTGIEQLRW